MIALLFALLTDVRNGAAQPTDFHDLSASQRSVWLEQAGKTLNEAVPARATAQAPAAPPPPAPAKGLTSAAIERPGPAPAMPAHDGGTWHTDRSGYVVLDDGQRLMGSRIFARSCFLQFSDSFRRWASAYSHDLNVAHLVATAVTETGCSEAAGLGSVDGKSTGLMQVTGYTCVDLLRFYGARELTQRACLDKMGKEPDFSVQLAAALISRPDQVKLTALDPPKVAAAYNSGGLYFDRKNPWRLRSTGNHIDRFVAAYNAYMSWQVDERAGRRTRSPAVHLSSSEALPKAVESPEALNAFSGRAKEGDIVFVGDAKTKRGDFYVFARGKWQGSLEDSER